MKEPVQPVEMECRWRIVNPKDIPREFWMLDQRKIWNIVRRDGEQANIPGIEIFKVEKARNGYSMQQRYEESKNA